MLSQHYARLLSYIHRAENPYTDFKYVKEDLDAQGWGSTHPWFEKLVDKYNRHKTVTAIEVGSWKGGSARHVASLFKKKSIDGVIICVDTWLAEEILWNSEMWRSSLKFKNGRPNVYQTFMANTVEAGLQDYIIPLSMPSLSAARYLKNIQKADFIYIDGCHVEGDVYRDLTAYWQLLRVGGTMMVDDYAAGEFDGLVRDVNKFCFEKGLSIEKLDAKCLIEKQSHV